MNLLEKKLDITKFGQSIIYPNYKTELNFQPELNSYILRFTSEVLSDKAGEPVSETKRVAFTTEIANFPQWLPKFLRRRWTKTITETKEVTLTVQPTWIYPDYALPEALGRQVGKFKILEQDD